MDKHDVILNIIEEIESETKKSLKIVNKNLSYKQKNLLPTFCFRTADLSYEMSKRLKDNREADELIQECFCRCTLTTFYYIHLNDLKNIILRHKKDEKWCVKLI